MKSVLTDLVADVRYAGRALRRKPGFTVLAVIVMALGIGANTAVFSVVSAVLLRPLPYPNPDRIVTLFSDYGLDSLDQVTIADFRDWRAQSKSFEAMATYRLLDAPVLPGTTAEYARTAIVDADFVRVFGIQPVIGRAFTRDDVAAENRVALISYAYWQSRFGGDRAAVNRAVRIGTGDWLVVGVLPPGFDYPFERDLWLLELTTSTSRTGRNFGAVARLAPAVPLEQARTELKAIAARLEQQFPDSNKGRSAAIVGLQDRLVTNVRLTLYLLWGVVGVVLLIACANTATLLLGKATVRTRELAVRAALGATRRRIIRQLMAESLLLALAGGALGVVLAYLGSDGLVALAPFDVVRAAGAGIDGTALVFTLAVSLATSVVFGIVPALHASNVDVSEALKQEGSRSVTAARAIRTRSVLVAIEISLAVVLLTSAGLLIRTLVALNDVDLGFEPAKLLVMRATGVGSQEQSNKFFSEAQSRIKTLPGVVAVGATMMPPGDSSAVAGSGSYFIDREPEVRDRKTEQQSFFTVIAPGTFAALGVPLKQGRDFTDSDTADSALVAIVNEELVRRSLSGVNPIGRTIFCNFDRDDPMTIVGVVGDVRQRDPANAPDPECFMPYQQHAYNSRTLHVVIRTTGEPTALVGAVRRVANDISADVPVAFTTMETTISRRVEAPRFRALLFAVLAALAVCLAMTGVYGVIAYSVEHRTQEIGLRMALGATKRSVLRLVLGQTIVLTAIGLALGLAGSAAATRLLETMLFEVQPIDPQVYIAVIAMVGLVAATAGYFPARRAASVSPMVAIRDERPSLLREAGERLRAAVREVTHAVSRGAEAEPQGAALLTEFAAAARQADTFNGALHGALTIVCERLGADSAAVLERTGDREYRSRVAVRLDSRPCTVPEDGFLIGRLAGYHGPLPFSDDELRSLAEWTAVNRPHRLDEIRALADARVRIAVALRTHDEIAGVLLLGPRDADRLLYGAAEQRTLVSCADQFALMIENARLNDRALEQEALRRDVALAAEVQRRLLPSSWPSDDRADFAAVSIPARTIGGDYYDFIEADGRQIGIALADVSGKGVAAALIMSAVQASLRIIATDREVSIPTLVARMNEFLYHSTPGNRYATFFYAQLDGPRRQLRYVNAGHNPPYLIRSDAIQELSAGGAVIGLLPGVEYEQATVDLCPGDVLLAFTDGVTEAHNPDNEEFGEERVKTLLRETAPLSAEEISSRFTASLRAWIRDAPQYDDLTLVVMKLK